MIDVFSYGLNALRSRVRYPRTHRLWTDFERAQWMSLDEIAFRQNRQLADLARMAALEIPFYQQWFRRAGVGPEDIRSTNDLRALPILTKDMIRAEGPRMLRPGHEEPVYRNHTGGSTGEPITFFQDAYYADAGTALTMRHNSWAGWRFGVRTAILWGADRDDETRDRGLYARLHRRYLRRELFLNSFNVDDAKLGDFTDRLRIFQPELIIGYANSLYLFALYLQGRGKRWAPGLRGIVSAAETLLPQQRAVIEEVFGAKVYNRYGSRDVGLMASECGEGTGLHVCAENVVLEIVRPDGRSAEPGEIGEVVVTGLLNRAMPLIRYAIGDVATAADGSHCPCGRGLPLVKAVEGRTSDIISLPNGRLVHGEYFTHLFYGRPGVLQFQVIQHEREKLRILLVTDANFDRSLIDLLRTEIQTHCGMGLELTFEFPRAIDLTRTGKHRFTVSEVPLHETLRKVGGGATPTTGGNTLTRQ